MTRHWQDMRYIVKNMTAYHPPYCISSSLALSLCRHYECSGTSYTKRPHKPAGDVELAGHAVHALAPGASLYFPASHAVHGPPLGPVLPLPHVQSFSSSGTGTNFSWLFSPHGVKTWLVS